MSAHGPILVGVDGSDASRAAIRYGAEEARRRGAMLRLVHVVVGYVPSATTYPMDYPVPAEETRRAGREILAAAELEAHRHLDTSQVSTVLLTGYRVPTLVQAAVGAHLVVLGDERRPALERVATSSVLSGVAAHATVPVVAVPASWAPAPGRPRVVAAVKDCRHSAGLVRRALEAAEDRGAELVLLHALPLGYAGTSVSVADIDDWDRPAKGALEELLRSAPPRSPDVDVRIEVRHGQAAHVLVGASKRADLLLVSRRPHAFPFGHLGGTGRAVLRASHCPVEVTPPADEPVFLDDFVLEHDGVLQKAVSTADGR